MVKFFRALFNKIASFFFGKEPATAPRLITAESNPELISQVKAQMEQFDTAMLTTRLLELEKAVYHMAGRQKELVEHVHQLEQVIIALSTTLDELMNGLDAISNGEGDMGQEGDEEGDDDEEINDAWEAKKGTSSLN